MLLLDSPFAENRKRSQLNQVLEK